MSAEAIALQVPSGLIWDSFLLEIFMASIYGAHPERKKQVASSLSVGSQESKDVREPCRHEETSPALHTSLL